MKIFKPRITLFAGCYIKTTAFIFSMMVCFAAMAQHTTQSAESTGPSKKQVEEQKQIERQQNLQKQKQADLQKAYEEHSKKDEVYYKGRRITGGSKCEEKRLLKTYLALASSWCFYIIKDDNKKRIYIPDQAYQASIHMTLYESSDKYRDSKYLYEYPASTPSDLAGWALRDYAYTIDTALGHVGWCSVGIPCTTITINDDNERFWLRDDKCLQQDWDFEEHHGECEGIGGIFKDSDHWYRFYTKSDAEIYLNKLAVWYKSKRYTIIKKPVANYLTFIKLDTVSGWKYSNLHKK